MKKTGILFFILTFALSFSQHKITVKNADNNTPIPNAAVLCKNKSLGTTDSKGILNFKTTSCNTLEITAKGFDNEEVEVSSDMAVFLTKEDPFSKKIETIALTNKSDPRALEILKKVNENYKNNSPRSLDSYSFKSYEKITLDIDQDSIKDYSSFITQRIDSLKQLPETPMKKNEKKDSLESVNFMKLITESKMFLWERASDFLYSKKHGEKINILDNRVSGLQQPIYEMMALRSNRNQLPREVREENRALYRFYLTDSIEIDGRQNFVIRFRQVENQQNKNRRKFNGYIYVDAETYGLKKIESSSKKTNEGSITSIWELYSNKWFLKKENFKVRMGSMVFDDKKKNETTGKKVENKNTKKFGNYVYMNADYFDYQSPSEAKADQFKGYTMEVKNSDGSLLDKFRTEELSEREASTYSKIDSVGKKYKIDQKAGVLTGLLKGNIRVGMVDFDISKIVSYNRYEKVRLGVAAKLNEKFNKYISPDAYFAYGFGDRAWKYGAGIDIKTTLEKNSFFRIEYFNDVTSSGRFNQNMWNFRMNIMNSGVDLNNDKFYHFKGFKTSFENDITNGITLQVAAKKTNEEALFLYDFMGKGNSFRNFSTFVTLKYSPNSRNIMTPSGKYTFEHKFPEVYFNYEQGLKILDGDFNYNRFDVLFLHQFKTKLGVTKTRLYGGIVNGEVPIWHHFSMNGLSNGNNDLNYNITSYLGFATMEGGKYFNDQFVGTHISHQIPWYFRSFGKRTSSFDVIYNGIVGDMKYPGYHHFLKFEKLNHLYQEVGLEYNNFLSTPLSLGFFHRVGYYQTNNFKDNFAIQLKFKILGF